MMDEPSGHGITAADRNVPPGPVYSVGHSNHQISDFIDLLHRHHIELVIDIRSQPASRHAPQFNRAALKQRMREARVGYLFMGNELGGRPPEPEFYDSEGRVLYGAVAGSPRFRLGIRRVMDLSARKRVALVCTEEDPTSCHRRLLVGRVLMGAGLTLGHIRRDGRLELEASDPLTPTAVQPDLFGGQQEAAWRSSQSVSPRRQPQHSLRISDKQEFDG